MGLDCGESSVARPETASVSLPIKTHGSQSQGERLRGEGLSEIIRGQTFGVWETVKMTSLYFGLINCTLDLSGCDVR